jgi:hypothetical protein
MRTAPQLAVRADLPHRPCALKTFQTMIAERSIRRRDGLQTKDEGGVRAEGRGRNPGQAVEAGVASQPEPFPRAGPSPLSNKAKAGKI